MRAAVRLIDILLSRSLGISIFSNDPEVILRIQLTKASYTVNIGDKRIIMGEPVLGVHAWNERMPKLPKDGPTVEWAIKLKRQTVYSFREIAKVIQQEDKYTKVRAVCGSSALFSFNEHIGGVQLMEHLGFIVLPYHRPLGQFGEFWENLFSWWLMWAYNDVSMKSREFWHLQRTEIWITTEEFMKRYAGCN